MYGALKDTSLGYRVTGCYPPACLNAPASSLPRRRNNGRSNIGGYQLAVADTPEGPLPPLLSRLDSADAVSEALADLPVVSVNMAHDMWSGLS
jgi:hypothetical protein